MELSILVDGNPTHGNDVLHMALVRVPDVEAGNRNHV